MHERKKIMLNYFDEFVDNYLIDSNKCRGILMITQSSSETSILSQENVEELYYFIGEVANIKAKWFLSLKAKLKRVKEVRKELEEHTLKEAFC